MLDTGTIAEPSRMGLCLNVFDLFILMPVQLDYDHRAQDQNDNGVVDSRCVCMV